MLIICGIGLKPKHITLEALEEIKNCDEIFLECYTSAYPNYKIEELERLLNKKIQLLYREDLEQKLNEFLENAKNKKVALLIFGNPFSATTHMQIFYESKKLNIESKVLPGISILNLIGKTGLEEYKFGRIVSIPFWQQNYKPKFFYQYIKQNSVAGLHTLCLLDLKITKEEKRFMSINEALEILKKVDEEKILVDKLCIALCGMSSAEEKIIVRKFKELQKTNFSSEKFPQSLIICGNLSEKEKEFLSLWR